MRYLHSDIDTLERIEIIRDLRLGAFDVLVGINLLREGLDIPECALVAILDADKEGYLRSKTSLVQTIGRAARNIDGRVILYADGRPHPCNMRSARPIAAAPGRSPTTARTASPRRASRKGISDVMQSVYEQDYVTVDTGAAGETQWVGKSLKAVLAELEKKMREAAANLEFEDAARYRDEIRRLEARELGLDRPGMAPAAAAAAGWSEADKAKMAKRSKVARRKADIGAHQAVARKLKGQRRGGG